MNANRNDIGRPEYCISAPKYDGEARSVIWLNDRSATGGATSSYRAASAHPRYIRNLFLIQSSRNGLRDHCWRSGHEFVSEPMFSAALGYHCLWRGSHLMCHHLASDGLALAESQNAELVPELFDADPAWSIQTGCSYIGTGLALTAV